MAGNMKKGRVKRPFAEIKPCITGFLDDFFEVRHRAVTALAAAVREDYGRRAVEAELLPNEVVSATGFHSLLCRLGACLCASSRSMPGSD